MTLDGSYGSELAERASWLGVSGSGSVFLTIRQWAGPEEPAPWGPAQPLSWAVIGHPVRRAAQGSSTSSSGNRAEGTSPVLCEPQKSRSTNFAAFLVTREVRSTPRFEGPARTCHLFIRGPSRSCCESRVRWRLLCRHRCSNWEQWHTQSTLTRGACSKCHL